MVMHTANIEIAPDSFPVSVITAREPVADNPWISERWRVVGVVPGVPGEECVQIRSGPDGEQYLWSGFTIRLRESEADSYYFNLVAQNPNLQVICQATDAGELRPVLVTADYIDGMAHREAGANVHGVAIPPDIYLWLERYVLEHYTPEEKKSRRKHDDRTDEAG